VLKDIFKHLYYPDSPYEFSVLPGGILGQVYERFLGKVVRVTPGRQVKIEEKPEVIKAGGVVYTPAFIAETIVRQVLGRLLAGKTVTTAGKLRLLDMACGSGIFLITLYQFLLDWHLAQYSAEPEKWTGKRAPRLYRTPLGEWRLTLDERKRILLDHVYGVDIDPQAVEVTKLSLLLKLLEGETRQTLDAAACPAAAAHPARPEPEHPLWQRADRAGVLRRADGAARCGGSVSRQRLRLARGLPGGLCAGRLRRHRGEPAVCAHGNLQITQDLLKGQLRLPR
jgi:hypothetical protein